MPTKSTRLRDNVTALAALRYEQAQIVDGHVTDAEAAAVLLLAVQAHVRALLACTPRPKPKPHEPAAVVDTAGMTDAELYAHYKRTASIEDLRFFLRGGKSAALLARARAITNPTAHDLIRLREAWRIERAADDRATGIPAIGTEAWHRQTRAEPIDDLGVL
jgi:hypothetical protein